MFVNFVYNNVFERKDNLSHTTLKILSLICFPFNYAMKNLAFLVSYHKSQNIHTYNTKYPYVNKS